MRRRYAIRAEWDAEAGIRVAESDDVPGLVTGAPDLPALSAKLRVLIPELLEANGCLPDKGGAPTELPIEIVARQGEGA